VPERLVLAKTAFGVETLDRSKLSSKDVTDRLHEMVPAGADVVIEADRKSVA